MRVVAVQLVFAGLPAAIFADVWASLRVVEEEIGWPSKILLPVRIVTLGPVMNGRVANRAEGSLVAIEHELVIGEHSLQVL